MIDAAAPPEWGPGPIFGVDRVTEFRAQHDDLEVVAEPHEIPGGMFMAMRDPAGTSSTCSIRAPRRPRAEQGPRSRRVNRLIRTAPYDPRCMGSRKAVSSSAVRPQPPHLALVIPAAVAPETARSVAVIDLGSNSWRLVVYRVRADGTWQVVGPAQRAGADRRGPRADGSPEPRGDRARRRGPRGVRELLRRARRGPRLDRRGRDERDPRRVQLRHPAGGDPRAHGARGPGPLRGGRRGSTGTWRRSTRRRCRTGSCSTWAAAACSSSACRTAWPSRGVMAARARCT